MSYIAAAPFVTQRVLGMSPLGFALSFAVSASAMVLANLVNIRLVSRIRPPRLLAAGIALPAFASGLVNMTGAPSIPAGQVCCVLAENDQRRRSRSIIPHFCAAIP